MATWDPNRIFPGVNTENYLYRWDGIGVSTQPYRNKSSLRGWFENEGTAYVASGASFLESGGTVGRVLQIGSNVGGAYLGYKWAKKRKKSGLLWGVLGWGAGGLLFNLTIKRFL
jgi:hypothetical protein